MDTPLCSLCVVYFQRALNSPVGEAVSSYIKLFDPPLVDEYNIFSILDKLRKNLYSTPEEWLGDLDKNVEQSLRFFGIDSEISIAIRSIQYNIRESTKHLLKGNNENWMKSRQKFLSSLESYLISIPNNEVSFRNFIEQPSTPIIPNQTPFIPSPLTIQNEKIDFIELKALIQNLPTDEDDKYLRDIISHYEPEYANASGTVPCDIRRFNPLTLHLIKGYAKKHALPLPRPIPTATTLSNLTDLISNSSLTPQKINPASIPRMKSTPLPPPPKDTKRPPPLMTDIKPSILANSSFAQPLSAKTSNSNSSSIASQNLHSSLKVAATTQVLAKTLSQAASQIHNCNNKNNNKHVSAVDAAAFSAISAVLESAFNSNSANSTFSARTSNSTLPPSSLKNANSNIALTSPFLKMNSPSPSTGDSDENGVASDSISPSSSRSEGFDHDFDDDNQNKDEK